MSRASGLLEGATIAVLVLDADLRIVRAERMGPDGWESGSHGLLGYSFPAIFGEAPSLVECAGRAMEGEPSSALFTAGRETFEARFSPISGSPGQVSAVNFILTRAAPPGLAPGVAGEEVLFRRMVEEAIDVVYLTDRHGNFTYINPPAQDLTGYRLDELVGMHFSTLIPESWRELVTAFYTDQYESKKAETTLEFPIRRRDGSERWIEQTVRLDREGGWVTGFQSIARDIDARKKAEQALTESENQYRRLKDFTDLKRASDELKRYADRLEVQNQIDQAILAAHSTREIARVVAERMRRLVPCERVAVALFDTQREEAVFIASDAGSGDEPTSEERFPLQGGDTGRLLDSDVHLVEDLGSLAEPGRVERELLEGGVHTYLSIPLIVRESLAGALILGASKPGQFTAEVFEIAGEVAGSLAVAIEQARLYEEVNDHARQLEERVQKLNASERYLALLNEITMTSISVDNLATLLDLLEGRLGDLLSADACRIILLKGDPRPRPGEGDDGGSSFSGKKLEALAGLVDSALAAGSAIYWGEGESGGLDPDSPKPVSILSLPLIAGDQKLGAALIAFSEARLIDREEIRRSEQAAAQIALAVANASLLDSERRRRQEAETLRTVSDALASTLDLKEVLDIILDQLAMVMEYDSAAILLWEGEMVKAVAGRGFQENRLAVGDKFPLDNPLFNEIRQTIKPKWLSDPISDPRFAGWGGTKTIRSWLGLPLVVHGKFLGFMTLDSYRPDAYGPSQAALVQPFANQAAQAIENASLFDWVQRQAITDALTNIYNRRGFFDLGQREVDRALRFHRDLVAVMLDIDLFKQVNDRLGHAIGDQVLAEIARRCVQVLRRVDLIGRYGGEEFAVLLPETDLEAALGIAERLRVEIAGTPIETDRGRLPVTISLGVASVHPSINDLSGLLDAADSAMYAAKQAGRNCVRVYSW